MPTAAGKFGEKRLLSKPDAPQASVPPTRRCRSRWACGSPGEVPVCARERINHDTKCEVKLTKCRPYCIVVKRRMIGSGRIALARRRRARRLSGGDGGMVDRFPGAE